MNEETRRPSLLFARCFAAATVLVYALLTAVSGAQRRRQPAPHRAICRVYAVELLIVNNAQTARSKMDGSIAAARQRHRHEPIFECEHVDLDTGVVDGTSHRIILSNEFVVPYRHLLRDQSWFVYYQPSWIVNNTIVPDDDAGHRPLETVAPDIVDRIHQVQQERRTGTPLTRIKSPHRDLLAANTSNVEIAPVLLVRVTVGTVTVSHSLTDLVGFVFDNNVSFMHQLAACSHGQIQLQPYVDPTVSDLPAVDVAIDGAPDDYDYNGLFLAANPVLKTMFGVVAMDDVVRHVIFVAPPGIQPPITVVPGTEVVAFAGIHHWKSVILQDWIDNVGVLLHEVAGHNRGLGHAYENNIEYNDLSGVMGSPVRHVNALCFNAGHFQALGLLQSRTLQWNYDDIGSNGRRIDIVAFVEEQQHQDGAQEQPAILRLGSDYWLLYNRNMSYNADTPEHQNRITMVSTNDLGDEAGITTALVAKFDLTTPELRVYAEADYFGAGQDLYIEACSVGTAPEHMTLSIGQPCNATQEVIATSLPTAPPTRIVATTIAPTVASQVVPTASPTLLRETSAPITRPSRAPVTPAPVIVANRTPRAAATTAPSLRPTHAVAGAPSALPVAVPTRTPTTLPIQAPVAMPKASSTSPTALSTTLAPAALPPPVRGSPHANIFHPIYDPITTTDLRYNPNTCNDNNDVRIYINATVLHQRCPWVHVHLDDAYNATHTVRAAVCQPGHDVFAYCAESCGQCYDACVDDDGSTWFYAFPTVNDTVMTCRDLWNRPYLWTIVCDSPGVRDLCRETCQNCEWQ